MAADGRVGAAGDAGNLLAGQALEVVKHDSDPLTLASPQPVVARMIALWGADQLIAVHATVEEAAGYGFRPRLRGSGDTWKIQGEEAA